MEPWQRGPRFPWPSSWGTCSGRRRHITHVPRVDALGRTRPHIGVAVLAARKDLGWLRTHREHVALMSCVSALLLPARRASASGSLLPGNTIRRRRHRALLAGRGRVLLPFLAVVRHLRDVFFPFAVAFSKRDPFFCCSPGVPLPDGNAFGTSLGHPLVPVIRELTVGLS